MSQLADAIATVLRIDPFRRAIEFEDGDWTWRDLAALANGLNEMLGALGLAEAEGVGCLLRNRPPHVAAIWGVILGERCVVTLNPVLPDDSIAGDICNMRPPVLLASRDDWDRPAIVEAAREVGAAGIALTGDRARPLEWVPGLDRIGTGAHLEPQPGVAVLMLTSGTTGQPKRAPLRYQQLEQNFKRAARGDINHGDALPMLKDDITLSFSPLVHISGMYFAISQAVEGRQVRLLERFSVDLWVTAVKELKLRTAGGPSTALKMILAASPPKESLASLVSVTSGAAGIEPEVVDQFLDKYGLPVLSTYGATEFAGAVCGWSLASFRKYWATKRGAAGRMHPGVEARTVDPESGKPLPSNTPGLLELKGPVIGDGQHWVRTSDLARIDEDHFLFVLGRADNAIIRGGFKVLPDEVVKAMEQHPAIKEASVVGLLDARLGAAPAAAYIVRDGEPAPSEVELAAFLRERLTPYQVPVRFKQVTELPRTPSMKISMPGVKALFEADA